MNLWLHNCAAPNNVSPQKCLWLGETACVCDTRRLRSMRQEDFDQLSCANCMSGSGGALYLCNLEMSGFTKQRLGTQKHRGYLRFVEKKDKEWHTKRGLMITWRRKKEKEEPQVGWGEISSGSKMAVAGLRSVINLLSGFVLLLLFAFSTPDHFFHPLQEISQRLSNYSALNSSTNGSTSHLPLLTPTRLSHTPHFQPSPRSSSPAAPRVARCWKFSSPTDTSTSSLNGWRFATRGRICMQNAQRGKDKWRHTGRYWPQWHCFETLHKGEDELTLVKINHSLEVCFQSGCGAAGSLEINWGHWRFGLHA